MVGCERSQECWSSLKASSTNPLMTDPVNYSVLIFLTYLYFLKMYKEIFILHKQFRRTVISINYLLIKNEI